MDQEAFLTPRKIFQNAFNAARRSTASAHSPSVKAYTPTSLSRTAAGTSRINLLPAIQTPPSRMVKGKVINPFEAHLTDRLHLPVICSPSLFQRPSTPQGGSVTQFEWTIDEVSYLGPANVEAHETQFMETPDPVLEAKAQAAISAYFKDHSIVPSPIGCQLRSQKILLNGESTAIDSFMGRKSKRKRDGVTQTVLTFPPILPKEVEDMLAPYFGFHDNQQQTHESINESDVSIDHDARDASLRRKLFNCTTASTDSETRDQDDSLDHLDMHSLSPAPVTPEVDKESVQNLKRSRCFGSQEIKIDRDDISLSPVVDKEKESFGALSPISKSSTSPSPLKPSSNSTEIPDHDAIYRSTPERPKSFVLALNCSANSHHMSVDHGEKQTDLTVDFNEEDLSYEDNPLASSQSSSSVVSQHPTTPLRHTPRERRRNRKNLSRSFLLYSDEDRFEEEQQEQLQLSKEFHHRSFAAISRDKENIDSATGVRCLAKSVPETSSGNFYRMDSGFNEEETRTSQETAEYETDVSMQSECCEGDRQTPQRFKIARWKMSAATNSDGQHHTGCSIRL